MNMRIGCLMAALIMLSGCFAGGIAEEERAILTVQLDSRDREISQTLYGLFFEDINHGADGGLYAEMLQNRSFEYEELLNPGAYQHLTGWAFNTSAAGSGGVEILSENPLHENNPTYLRVTAESAGYAFQNLGFPQSAWKGNLSIQAGQSYDVSLWLRSAGEMMPGLHICLTTKTGEPLSNEVVFTPAGKSWSRQEGVLTALTDASGACLTFRMDEPGTVELDMASLMTRDRVGADWPGGGLRRDLVLALKELHPRFLRFPGGCVIEGSWVWDNLYRWKDTVGPVEQRKENWNTWGYMQSYGLGFYEYFCLCEEIGALPLPVVGSGVLCQAREPAENPMDEEMLQAWIYDILDLIDFASGNSDTIWGQLRAEMGHPEPFDLRYLAIGNENWGNVYFDRYEKIRSAVLEKAPEITCIVANGPVAEGALFNAGKNSIRTRFAEDIADEHYYMDSDWFLRNTHRYDLYSRETSVFVGEYAAHEPAVSGRRPNNFYSALCEAAYLTGIERNGDVVVMCSYAPLLARTGLEQWTPNLIWFNETQVLRTPNYYVQQMFSNSLGNWVLDSAWVNEAGEGITLAQEKAHIYRAASLTEDGTLYVKLVNVSGSEQQMLLRLEGKETDNYHEGTLTMLSGEKQAVNGYEQERIYPQSEAVSLDEGKITLKLPPYSVMVMEWNNYGI